MTIKNFLDELNKKDPIFWASPGEYDYSVHIRLLPDLKKSIRVPQKKDPSKFNICDVAFAHIYEKTGDNKLFWFSKATNSNSIIGHKCISDIFHNYYYLSSDTLYIKDKEDKKKREAKEVLYTELNKIIDYLHNLDKTNIDLNDLDYGDAPFRRPLPLKNNHLSEEVETPEQYIEGASKIISVNAYERDADARRKCIEYYGYKCDVCSFDFEHYYGDIGKHFIHVHHIVPLAEIRKEYEVDPVRDLIPICPNCHAIIHRTQPALTIKQLKDHLENKGKNT